MEGAGVREGRDRSLKREIKESTSPILSLSSQFDQTPGF